MSIIFTYIRMQDVVDFALQTLRDKSPVGSGRDPHPGLYRDSHLVFFNGHVVSDVGAFKAGDQINIANPEPYARKIEAGSMKMSLPGHVYEDATQIVTARFGNAVAVRFTFMPVSFGNGAAVAAFSARQRTGRRVNDKSLSDWLARQPSIQITAR